MLRLESDADLVQVVTVHKSKGLEYPVVLLPFVGMLLGLLLGGRWLQRVAFLLMRDLVPAYAAMGIRDEAGVYQQLNTSLLQIENEFYGTIRPKRVIFPGERPLHALRERGVEYVEVRCMDLDPFEPVGINAQTMRFIDIFLLHCLLSDSPPDAPEEVAALARNQERTAARGREPGLRLERGGREVGLVDWGIELLEECAPIARVLDAACGGSQHHIALQAARAAFADAALLPQLQAKGKVTRGYLGVRASDLTPDLVQAFPDLLDLGYTRDMEKQLDRVQAIISSMTPAERRRPASRPPRPCTTPTTPVRATPSCTSSTPARRSASATRAAVRRSSKPSSGWACRSRRNAVSSPCH